MMGLSFTEILGLILQFISIQTLAACVFNTYICDTFCLK